MREQNIIKRCDIILFVAKKEENAQNIRNTIK